MSPMDEAFIRIESCKRETSRVVIPSEIDGLPVRAIGSDIFQESDVIEELVCPDSIAHEAGSVPLTLGTDGEEKVYIREVSISHRELIYFDLPKVVDLF